MSSLSNKLILAIAFVVPSLALAADSNGVIWGTGLTTEYNGDSSNGFDTLALNSSNDSFVPVFQMPAAGSLTDVCVYHSARNAGNPAVITIAAQGVTTGTGLADGSTKASGSASCTYDPPAGGADDYKIRCCTFTSGATVAAGDLIAFNSSSSGSDGSNNSTYAVSLTGNNVPRRQFPYVYTITDGGAAVFKQRMPVFGFKIGSTWYGWPVQTTALTQYSSDTGSIDERAIAFTFPTSMCSTATVKGVRCVITPPATGKSVNVIQYSGTTDLSGGDAVIYGDVNGFGTPAANDRHLVDIFFTTPPTLTCGNQYFIGFQPTATATNFAIQEAEFINGSTSLLSAMPFGANVFMATRVDGGSWDTTTYAARRLGCDFIMGDITAPAGSSGPKQNLPGSGGMQ